MEKLKSSIKSLQDLITNNIQSIGPTCINETRTQSFRAQAIHHHHHYDNKYYHDDQNDIDDDHNDVDELQHTSSSSTSSSSPCGFHKLNNNEDDFMSSSSKKCHEQQTNNEEFDDDDDVLRCSKSSNRFFFSPCTKSIMEEGTSKLQDNIMMASFCEYSHPVVMNSDDPFFDFRSSMEEMVAVHELREWRCLQELLRCYLSLNEKENHKVIVFAFVDLLMQIISHDHEKKMVFKKSSSHNLVNS